MLLGPAFSGVTQPIAEITSTWNLVQVWKTKYQAATITSP